MESRNSKDEGLGALGQVQETLSHSVQAKVISEEDFENLLEKSTTCVVFVKNVPEELCERMLGLNIDCRRDFSQ